MKTSDYTGTPSAADQAPKGFGALDKAATGAHNVVDKVASAADEAARKVPPVIDRAAKYAHRTVDRAVTGVAPAADWISDQATALDATQKRIVRSTRAYVVANPLKSLGIALAAGYLVSRMMRK